MKDFSFWNIYEGNFEGSGRSEKIWLINPDNNQIGLFKYKKDVGTTDNVSECIAYDLATIIGIPCAKFELGIYKGHEGSISYNILSNEDEVLTEGINYITQRYPLFNVDKSCDEISGDMYSIEMIKEVLDGVVEFKDFLRIPVFDFLIGNTDRHCSNWAIIEKSGEYILSPLYDNSSSLCAYMNANELKILYEGKDKNKWNAIVDTKSRSTIRCTKDDNIKSGQKHSVVIKYLHDNYYDESKYWCEKVIDKLDEVTIDRIVEKYADEELSRIKKEVIKKYLKSKVNLLKKVFFEDNQCQ